VSTLIDILYVILASVALFLLKRYIDVLKKATETDEFRAISDFRYKDSKEDVNNFINEFLTDCLNDYVMYNIVPDTGLDFISKEREDTIRKDITNIVANRLSNTLKKKIYLCYSEEYFTELLAEKIFYLVTVYVADFNSEKNPTHKEHRPKPKKQKEIDIENDW
jgi:hypothetical protein